MPDIGETCLVTQDKRGRQFGISTFETEDIPFVLQMYRYFQPKGAFQGLPPRDEADLEEWVFRLAGFGYHYLSWMDGLVVGHAMLLPDTGLSEAEYLIFVVQSHRNRGLGTALTAASLDLARDLGLREVWLSVEAHNFPAIHLYRKFGFRFHDKEPGQRIMRLDLLREP